jgi:hypothetical protein
VEQIDVMLDEFGAEQFVPGEDAERMLQRVRTLPDEKLLALHAHLHPDERASARLPTSGEGGPWQPDHFRLFISHTHQPIKAKLGASDLGWPTTA